MTGLMTKTSPRDRAARELLDARGSALRSGQGFDPVCPQRAIPGEGKYCRVGSVSPGFTRCTGLLLASIMSAQHIEWDVSWARTPMVLPHEDGPRCPSGTGEGGHPRRGGRRGRRLVDSALRQQAPDGEHQAEAGKGPSPDAPIPFDGLVRRHLPPLTSPRGEVVRDGRGGRRSQRGRMPSRLPALLDTC